MIAKNHNKIDLEKNLKSEMYDYAFDIFTTILFSDSYREDTDYYELKYCIENADVNKILVIYNNPIKISIEDAFRGTEKKIKLRTVDGSIKTLKVSVPAGIQNNEKIRIVGQGKPGKNGGKNGDLFARVKIKDDAIFKLDGYNLRADLKLTPWEAALSTKTVFNGINEDINVYVPSGTQSGEQITIPNRGYKDGKGGRGNLILEAKIMVPKHVSPNEKVLYEQLSKQSNYNPRID